MFNKKTKIALLVCLFLIGIFTGSAIVNSQIKRINDPLNRLNASADKSLSTIFTPASTFHAVMRAMSTEYVDKITPEFEGKMSVNLVKGMLRETGDQNTRYVEPEEVAILLNAEKGQFEGIGIKPDIKSVKTDGIKEEQLLVGAVIPGSNAEKAGLESGDIITKIDGKNILPYNPLARTEKALNDYRMKPDTSKYKELQKFIEAENKRIDEGIQILEAEKKLERGEGKTYTLTIQKDSKEKAVQLSTAKYSLPIITSEKFNSYNYIKINYISSDLSDEIKKAISDSNKNLILDLRNVFGGSSKAAIDTLGIFIPGKAICRISGRKNNILKTPVGQACKIGKLMLLVNGGTSGCSELIAIALRDNIKDTVIAGTKTAGNLYEISFFSLDNGGGYTITSGKYMSLANKELNQPEPQIFFTPKSAQKPDEKFVDSIFAEK